MSQNADTREFIHRIDRDDRISFVNSAWLAFAAENGWATTASQVLGSPLLAYISDTETRHLYRLLIDRTRDTGHPARILYRCDSPDCRRFMEMRIRNEASDDLEFRSRVLRLEHRDHVNVLDPSFRKRSSDILTVCSWCKAVFADGAWSEVEEALLQTGILPEAALPQICHGICPTCRDALMRETRH